ncbi:MAG: non-ribosomal peptide synthetase, partial [Cyanobacteria bacterium J06632_22]
VDIMQATPATWRLLLSCGWSGQSGLRLLCGGEALDTSLAQRLLRCAEEVWNVYGPTETTIWSGALMLSAELIRPELMDSELAGSELADAKPANNNSADSAIGSVPIGHPLDNTRFYVLDEEKKPVPIGVAGELYIGGVGLTQGYWQRPELTAERFVPNPLAISEVNRQCCPMLYKTGDRVCYREDGTLTYLGRFDQQTKLRGYRIELGEVEAEIATYPSVAQAVVVVQGDRPENQRLVAYMTLGAQTAETTDDSDNLGQIIRARLAGVLPTYMIPAAYQVLASFPLTPNGKIDRKALPAVVASTASVQIQPTTPVETVLAEIWQSLLGIDRVSRHDNFFDVGGHSLLIVNAQSQIRQRLAVEVSLMDLFHYPTLSTLADFIQRQQQGQSEEATSAEPERAEALSAGKQRLNQRQNQRLKQRRNRESLGGAQS